MYSPCGTPPALSNDQAGSIASLKELNPDVILLCFNVDDPSSIHFLKSDVCFLSFAVLLYLSCNSTRTQVVRQVGRVCSDKPILFVACKKDVRTDPSELERLRRIDKRLIDPSEVRQHPSLCTIKPLTRAVRV